MFKDLVKAKEEEIASKQAKLTKISKKLAEIERRLAEKEKNQTEIEKDFESANRTPSSTLRQRQVAEVTFANPFTKFRFFHSKFDRQSSRVRCLSTSVLGQHASLKFNEMKNEILDLWRKRKIRNGC